MGDTMLQTEWESHVNRIRLRDGWDGILNIVSGAMGVYSHYELYTGDYVKDIQKDEDGFFHYTTYVRDKNVHREYRTKYEQDMYTIIPLDFLLQCYESYKTVQAFGSLEKAELFINLSQCINLDVESIVSLIDLYKRIVA